jgi:hypothetical protein
LIKNNNKIDIDGYELEALQGMNNILKNLSPYFIIELLPKEKLKNKIGQDIINYMKNIIIKL